MAGSLLRLQLVVDLFVITALCLILFALMMPNIEEGRQEAQISGAWHDVREIRKAQDDPDWDEELPTRDAWGQPYRTVTFEDGSIRVYSTGPDKVSTSNGQDADDIHSEMPSAPLERFQRRRTRELWIAALCAGIPWIVISALRVRTR